ncbi:MAG: acyltransferase family protein [Sumerlaeia bacterium]
MSNIAYRPDIDGLRAVAVLGVVLFHADLGFRGGYVGVDVFFVISGFLITSIILRDLERGDFSLANFWVRRIRRILPALAAMVLCVLGAGLWLLDSEDLRLLAESAIAQSVMGANFYFAADDGYFAQEAEMKLLLHTWSLAVEEQFYLLFPLLTLGCFRAGRRWLLPVFGGLLAASLLLSILMTDSHQKLAFLWLPFRAWELLAGALLSVKQRDLRWRGDVRELLSAAGLGLIVLSMLVFDESLPFPGAYAVVPVLGAVLVMGANTQGLTWSGRLLAWRPMVFVGLISYSLYLWHWPLLVFGNYVLIERDGVALAAILALSFGMSVLSWKFIENPFRRKTVLKTRKSAFAFGGAVTAGLLVAAVGVLGYSKRPGLDDRFAIYREDIDWRGREFSMGEDGEPVPIGAEASTANAPPDFVFWGDSHALAISDMVDRKAAEAGLRGEAYLEGGSTPIPGLWRVDSTPKERAWALETNAATLTGIFERGVSDVILVKRWSVSCSGQSQLRVELGKSPKGTLVTDDPKMSLDRITESHAEAVLEEHLRGMIVTLEDAGVRVWLLKQVPETDNYHTARHFSYTFRYPLFNSMERYTTTRAEHEKRQACFESVLKNLGDHPNLTVIDPTLAFFDNSEGRLEIYSERSHYRDDNHLTRYGAEKYLGPIFEEVFAEIAADKTP